MRLHRASLGKLVILAASGAGFGLVIGYVVCLAIWVAGLVWTNQAVMTPTVALAICGAFAAIGALLATTEM